MKKFFSANIIGIIVWVWLFVVFGVVTGISYLLVVFIHEFGHLFIAKKLGYKLKKFSLSAYGVELLYDDQQFNFKDELKIAFAGPVVNILSVVLIFALWWVWPTTFFFTEVFVKASLILALFNLLPAHPLDGGRIFVALASHFCKEKTARNITVITNFVLSIFFFVFFFVCMFINFNPSLLLFSIFLFIGGLNFYTSTKFEKINIFCKKEKSFISPTIKCIYTNITIGEIIKKMQDSKTHIFALILNNGKIINISEKMIVKLSINYDLNTKLSDIFEKNR